MGTELASLGPERPCAACGEPLEPGRTIRARYHRRGGCKKRAWRRTKAGLPEDALPHGRRGRVPLGALTRADKLAAILIVLERTRQTLGRELHPQAVRRLTAQLRTLDEDWLLTQEDVCPTCPIHRLKPTR